MFSHNGFLMIGFELVYLCAVYLFNTKKIRSLFDITTFLIPVFIYCIAWLTKYSLVSAVILSVVLILFYCARLKRSVYIKMIRVEDVLIVLLRFSM